jgi:hypothetical protein
LRCSKKEKEVKSLKKQISLREKIREAEKLADLLASVDYSKSQMQAFLKESFEGELPNHLINAIVEDSLCCKKQTQKNHQS